MWDTYKSKASDACPPLRTGGGRKDLLWLVNFTHIPSIHTHVYNYVETTNIKSPMLVEILK